MISFSEMELPFETTGCKLYRRDLYDARFQVIDELDDDEEEDGPLKPEPEQEDQEMSKYVDADTDLIPGMYEGGLKTWEGGMDLVEILEEQHHRIVGGLGAWVQGKRVLEVGDCPVPVGARLTLVAGRLRYRFAEYLHPAPAIRTRGPLGDRDRNSPTRLQSFRLATRHFAQPHPRNHVG